jgi:hypothetical protein
MDSQTKKVRCSESSNIELVETSVNVVQPRIFILSGHQPTLLPYPGFFYKMYHSDIMDICPYDPFTQHNDRYQHRVKIGTDDNWKWLTLPVDAHNGYSIMQVKLKTHLMKDRWEQLEKVYGKYPLWDEYKNDLNTIFFDYKYLWEVNLRLILWIRDLLKIKTYISISWKGTGNNATERIASQFADYDACMYLAGKGTSNYLDEGKYEKLAKSKVALITYTPPSPFSTVTILTPLLMYSPEKVLQILNIQNRPITVLINGIERSLQNEKATFV